MNFVVLAPFAKALEMRLKQKSIIILHFSDLGNPTWFERKRATNEQLLDSCDRFISFLEKSIAYLDFEALPELEWESMRHLVDVCELYVSSVESRDKNAKQIPDFKARMASIRVGGTIPAEILRDKTREDTQFFRANNLSLKFLGIGVELKYHPDKGMEIPIEHQSKEVRFVNFDDMKRVDLSDGNSRFFCGEDWAFDVDKDQNLIKPFTVIGRGIARLASDKSSDVEAVIKRPIAKDKKENIIEVRINKEVPGEYIQLKREDGSWFAFELKKGKINIPFSKISRSLVKTKYCCYKIPVSRNSLDSCLEKIGTLKSTTTKAIASGTLLELVHEVVGLSKVPMKKVFTLKNSWQGIFKIWQVKKKDPAQVNCRIIFAPWKMREIDFDGLENQYHQLDQVQYHETP